MDSASCLELSDKIEEFVETRFVVVRDELLATSVSHIRWHHEHGLFWPTKKYETVIQSIHAMKARGDLSLVLYVINDVRANPSRYDNMCVNCANGIDWLTNLRDVYDLYEQACKTIESSLRVDSTRHLALFKSMCEQATTSMIACKQAPDNKLKRAHAALLAARGNFEAKHNIFSRYLSYVKAWDTQQPPFDARQYTDVYDEFMISITPVLDAAERRVSHFAEPSMFDHDDDDEEVERAMNDVDSDAPTDED